MPEPRESVLPKNESRPTAPPTPRISLSASLGSTVCGSRFLNQLSERMVSASMLRFFSALETALARVQSTLLFKEDGTIAAYHLGAKAETGVVGKLSSNGSGFEYISVHSSIFENGKQSPFIFLDSLLKGASAIPPGINWLDFPDFRAFSVQMGFPVDPTIVRVLVEYRGGEPLKIDLIRAVLVCGAPQRQPRG
jgi:hypothetical protein